MGTVLDGSERDSIKRLAYAQCFSTTKPFAQTREQLGDYFFVNADMLDEAIHSAGQIPGARLGVVEIRPIM
ncbi:MAG: hypothetical protein HYR56_11110 [Acidobacteria bacterium]|nr:hypothetical protein [Acidobacteriota bacterium]MBI3423846.1 hypothetical protein [Acidobacteriota bacterium]